MHMVAGDLDGRGDASPSARRSLLSAGRPCCRDRGCFHPAPFQGLLADVFTSLLPSTVPFCTLDQDLPCQVLLNRGDLTAHSVKYSCQKHRLGEAQLQTMCFSLRRRIPCQPELLIWTMPFPSASFCLQRLGESCLRGGKEHSQGKVRQRWGEHRPRICRKLDN